MSEDQLALFEISSPSGLRFGYEFWSYDGLLHEAALAATAE